MRILYLISGIQNESRSEFRNRVLAFAGEKLVDMAESVVVAVTESKPPLLSVIPFRRDLMSLMSLDDVPEDAEWPAAPEGFLGAYVSDVAYPVVHERKWPLGEPSPGAGLLTLFRRGKGLGEEEFLRRWYEGHTRLTLEVHPNVGYVRNRVTGIHASAGSPANSGLPDSWDGIVEEQYDPPADLLNPARFFGGSLLNMPKTMLRVYRDVRGFIDYPSIRTWLTREYRLK